jgi:chromosome segregation ATPase
MASEVLGALSVAGLTVAALFAALTVFGLGILARRGRRGAVQGAGRSLELEADGALLRLDDAVAASADEVAFATAQFGADRAQPFADALDAARKDLAEAFALKHRLEDASPESDTRRREWTRRIATLCERSTKQLEAHSREFSALRSAEADAPERLRRARQRHDQLSSRVLARRRAVDELAARFDASAVSGIRGSVAAAIEELTRAASHLTTAEAGLGGPVTAVGDSLVEAERSLQRVDAKLAAAEDAERNLGQSTAELEQLTSRARTDLDEARARGASAPDADVADTITGAVAEVEEVLAVVAAPATRADPVRAVDRVQIALAHLDTALATARNQEQRMLHARQALEGALFSARSQIATARGALGERGRSAGTDARVRLAEAERELELAVRTADPVEALDAARRAATHARDADALARYRG